MRALVVLGIFLSVCVATAQGQQRRAFEIAVGPVSGDLYVQGERLAAVVSHPPGLSRCADAALCGPEGVIATARATSSLSEGLLAIARGEVASAFSPADVAIGMRLNAGKGKQNQSRLRALGIVGEETLYVIAAGDGPVKRLSGLRGRWVAIGAKGGRTRVAANALLAAAKIKPDAIKISEAGAAEAAELMAKRKLDAFVWIGAKLPTRIATMVKSGAARIVPLDSGTVTRLVTARLGYVAKRIENGATISVPIVWIADEKQADDMVFGIVRAAFDARNTAQLNPVQNDPSSLKLARVAADFPLPLHAGAAKFFSSNANPSN